LNVESAYNALPHIAFQGSYNLQYLED